MDTIKSEPSVQSSMQSPGPKAAELVTALLQALAHKIRTPLSVISNDLNYFATLIDPDECSRSKRRCHEIDQILRDVVTCSKAASQRPNCTASVLLEHLEQLWGC